METENQKELHSHIKEQYQSKTTVASTICRTIVFAMIATTWLFFRKDGLFLFTPLACKTLLLFVIYLSLDILQYFGTSVLYGISFFFKKKFSNLDRFIDGIDIFSFVIFALKIVYLFVVMIVIIVYIMCCDSNIADALLNVQK